MRRITLAAALLLLGAGGVTAHEGHKAARPATPKSGAKLARSTSKISASRIIRVPKDYPTIQRAIDAAAPFDTVEVAAGAYLESVVLSSGQRGLVLRAAAGPEQTVLQGSGDARLVTFDEVDTLTTLQGFTLKDGGPQFDGGAFYAYHSKVRIANCVFLSSRTPGDGGALALYESVSWLDDNRIEGNNARRGGGIFVGGGHVTLRRTIVRDNAAEQAGGGLYCDDGATADTSGCRFEGNRPTDVDRNSGGSATGSSH